METEPVRRLNDAANISYFSKLPLRHFEWFRPAENKKWSRGGFVAVVPWGDHSCRNSNIDSATWLVPKEQTASAERMEELIWL